MADNGENRDNNVRRITQFLREIQQLSDFSTSRNNINVNINYYEKYYDYTDNLRENPENFVDRNNREVNHRHTPRNRYYIEIDGENVNSRNVNSGENIVNNSENTRSENANSNSENIESDVTNNENRSTRSPQIIRSEITIPIRTNSNLNDIVGTYPVDLTNSLSDIGSLINRTLNEGLTNITIDNMGAMQSVNSTGMSLGDLNTKTTLITYSSIEDNDKEVKCHICNEDYKENDILRKNNNCGHYLHQTCLDNWYSSNNSCPICNTRI